MFRNSPQAAVAAAILQQTGTLVLIGAAAILTFLSLGATAGQLPWLELPAAIGGVPVENAGIVAQTGATLLLLALAAYLPSNARVRRLEVTSRRFHLSMDDVTRAYAAVHAADRAGVFGLSREFDAMRERIGYMRTHPDLAELEPEVIEVAAQMSVESRDLAAIYADEKVARARAVLRQRQAELEDYGDRIAAAQAVVDEIRRWMQAVSVEEGLAEKQLGRLRGDLAEMTDALCLTGPDRPRNVVGMPPRREGGEKMATPAE